MKTIVFAVQVFGLIALFSLYVILEFNHGTKNNAIETGVQVDVTPPAAGIYSMAIAAEACTRKENRRVDNCCCDSRCKTNAQCSCRKETTNCGCGKQSARL